MVKYIADSACDLKDFPDICFETVPLTLSTDSRTIVDSPDLDIHETLDYFYGHHGRSYTAYPSTQAWIDSFEGADEIYVVTITSGLSGTWNSANVARKQYQSEHPDVKIYVVDSLSTGPGEVLLLEKIVELKKLGKSFEEVCEEIERYKDTLRLYFGLRSLHNLAQNGRVSKIVASAIGFMNIRILGTASKEGKIRICHVESAQLAQALEDQLRSEYGAIDIKTIPARGLCSFYAERGGFILGCEC